MKNKKGFTLIELLAVIVILAIIALIATPIILNIINDARKSAAVDSAYGYIEAIEYQNSMSKLNNEKYKAITSKDVSTINGLVNLKGTKPTSGNVEIDESGRVIEAILCINGYNIDYNGEKAKVTDIKCGSSSKEEISSGPTKELPTGDETYKAIVYLDPTDLEKKCTKEDVEKNVNEYGTPTGIKTGCMKFYAFAETDTTYDLILNHNTSGNIAWVSKLDYIAGGGTEEGYGSYGNADKGPLTVLKRLKEDTVDWKLTARLMTIDDVSTITKYSTWDKSSYYYLETNTNTKPNPYNGTYGWLYEYTAYSLTDGCLKYGCVAEDMNQYEYGTTENKNFVSGYWMADYYSDSNISYLAWFINNYGGLSYNDAVFDDDSFGVRPVITVDKSIIS